MTRRVLVLTYFFPPVGGVGVQRTMKFVEHLPAAGWEPAVLAPRGAAYRVMDPALLDRLSPDLEVHRVLCPEPAALRAMARSGLRWLRRAPGGTAPASARPGRSAPDEARGPRAWLNTAWATWVRTCFVPDEQMAWVPIAALAAAGIHRDRPFDAIYSSSPPASTHLAAGLAKSLTGRPWVADLRDPWVGNAFAARRGAATERLERWLERWAITRADRVVFATPRLRARYAERYPSRADRFVTVTNGYDRAEIGPPDREASTTDGPFRIVYAGSVYGADELRLFLDGLEIAVDRRPDLRDGLRVEFIGWMTPSNQALAEAFRARLAPVLGLRGFVPRDEAVACVRDADASLLLLADGPDRDLFIGAKLFEAIGLDRPVLAIAPPGDARDVLRELDWGVVADPRPDSVADALEAIVAEPPSTRRADPEGRFDRRRLAARLADVLDDAVRSSRRGER